MNHSFINTLSLIYSHTTSTTLPPRHRPSTSPSPPSLQVFSPCPYLLTSMRLWMRSVVERPPPSVTQQICLLNKVAIFVDCAAKDFQLQLLAVSAVVHAKTSKQEASHIRPTIFYSPVTGIKFWHRARGSGDAARDV